MFSSRGMIDGLEFPEFLELMEYLVVQNKFFHKVSRLALALPIRAKIQKKEFHESNKKK